MRGGCCSYHLRREHRVAGCSFVFPLPRFLPPAATLGKMSSPILLLLNVSKGGPRVTLFSPKALSIADLGICGIYILSAASWGQNPAKHESVASPTLRS